MNGQQCNRKFDFKLGEEIKNAKLKIKNTGTWA
jgi:hypothetical protein